jgi:hypothetical protein
MIKKLLVAIAALAVLAIGAAVATARPVAVHKTYRLSATLAPAPHAKGAAHSHGRFTGTIKIVGAQGSLSWTLTFLVSSGKTATSADIQLAPSGKILIPLCQMCQSGQVLKPFTGPLGGHSEILKAILGGHTYVNVRTAKNPKGEIRGFIRASAAA